MSNEPEYDDFGWVRVTDKDTGHRLSVTESQFPHGNFTPLKADASDDAGNPLPPEHNYNETSTPAAVIKKENSNA